MFKEFVFYCNWGVCIDGGDYFIDPVHLKYLNEINKRNIRVILVTKEVDKLAGKVKIPNCFEIKLLPNFKGYIGGLFIARNIISIAKELSLTKKIYYIRYPEPFAWLFMLICHSGSHLGLHLMSNPFKAILAGGNRFFSYLKVLAYLPSFLLHMFITKLSRQSVFSCNGEGLSSELNLQFFNVCVLNESTLDGEDFYFNDFLGNVVTTKLLYVGFLREPKGIQFLIEALSSLRNNGFNVVLDIVGDGPYKETLERKIKMLGVCEHVNFLGHVPYGEGLLQLYRNSDIFILPSLTEGSPRVIIEAMANSLPVISTQIGRAHV